MNIDEEMFWMVYVDGGGAPAVRWTSLGQAESEAQRLATKEGRTAYVLEGVSGYRIQKPQAGRFALKLPDNGSKFSSTTGCGGSYEFKK
jgi:hypothetical protein